MKKIITKAMVVLSLAFFAVSAKGQLLPCATPTSLTVLELTPTTARLSWGTGNGDNPFGWYNVRVSTIPLADPRAATGANIVFSGSVQGGLALPFLTPNTKYYTYVRTDCDTLGNYNGYSVWIRDSITTPCVATTFPITADFNEVTIPSCWRVAGGSKPVTNVLHYGSSGRSVRLQATTTMDSYLISAPISESANNMEITFYAYGVSGSKFRVGILYDLLNLSSIQEILPITVTADNAWIKYTVTTPASVSALSDVYVVFYMPSGSAQTVYIDDVDIHAKPACAQPQGLEFSNVTYNSVVLKWTETGSATSWIVRYTTGTGVSKTMPANSNNPFILPTLLSSTEYTVSVAGACGGEFSMPVTFTTPQTPAIPPYQTGFETGEDVGWTLVNGNQVNKWFIGSASGATYDGSSKALYISSSRDGSVYKYDSISPAAPAPAVQSFVWAFRTLNLQKLSYTVSFKWKANGQINADLLRAFLVPDTVKFTAGDAKKMTGTVNTTPVGWIDVPTSGSDIGILNKKTTWQSVSTDVVIANAGIYNLVFFWKNDNFNGGVPPAAIDNVSVVRTACYQPQNIKVAKITKTSAEVSFDPGGKETNWELRIMNGDNVYSTQPTTSSPTVVPNLQPGTDYTVQLRSICGVDDTSAWTLQVKFTTVCVKPLAYTENFESYTQDIIGSTSLASGATFPNNVKAQCWMFPVLGATYSTYPQVFLTNYNTGLTSKYLVLKSTSTLPAYAVLPEFTEPIGNLLLSFNYRNYNSTASYGIIQLGVMSDPMDTSTFKLIQSLPVSSAAAAIVHDFSKDNLPPNALNIAFKYVQTQSTTSAYYSFLDDIVVEALDCQRPTNVKATKVTTTTASITFNGNVSQYDLDINGNVTTYSTDSIPLTGLIQNTLYTVKVRSNCGANKLGVWTVAYKFRTMCDPQTPISYKEDFEKYSTDISGSSSLGTSYLPNFPDITLPQCWTFPVLGANYNLYPQAFLCNSTSYPPGSNSKYLLIKADPANPAYAVLPKFNKPLDSLTLAFRYKYSNGSYGTLYVGTMTDAMDPTSFVTLEEVPKKLGAKSAYKMDFNNTKLPADAQYIAFKYVTTSNSYFITIDSVMLGVGNCFRPHFKLSNTTNTTVDMAIDDNGNTAWEYCAMARDSVNAPLIKPPGAVSGSITGNNYQIQNLIPNTKYDIYLRGDCGAGKSDWVGPDSIVTYCDLTPLPYLENFDKYKGKDVMTSSSAPGTYPIHLMPKCWRFPGMAKANTDKIFLTNYSSYAPDKKNYLFIAGGTATKTFAVLPEFDQPLSNLILSFSYTQGSSTTPPVVSAGYMTDASDTTTFVKVETFPVASRVVLRAEHDFSYDKVPAAAHYLAFRFTSASTGYMGIDSVTVRYSACARPETIIPGVILNTSAEVKAVDVANTNNQWEFIMGAPGFKPENTAAIINTIISTNKTATFPNLLQNTYYDFYVRSICSAGTSDWRGPLSLKTECDEFTPPYTEDFEYGTNWTTSPLGCWQMLGISSNDTISNLYKIHGNKSMVLTNVTAISPRFNVTRLADYQVTGYAYSTADSARFSIGVMTNPSDITTFEPIKNFNIFVKKQWIDFGTVLDTLLTPQMANVAASKYIVLYFPTEKPIYIDYLSIEQKQSCMSPNSVLISNITNTQATLNWKAGGKETKWQAQVLQGANIISSKTLNVTSDTIKNLTPSTVYTVRLRSICAPNDTSNWTMTFNFKTTCSQTGLPYYQTFESYADFSTQMLANVNMYVAPNYPNHTMPECWAFPDLSPTNKTYPQAFLCNYSSNTPSLSTGKYLVLRASAESPAVAVLPEFNVPINELKLSFRYKNYTTSNDAVLEYGVMSDASNTATFLPIESLARLTTSGGVAVEHKFENDLLPANARFIAFRAIGSSAATQVYANFVTIDDIAVERASRVAPTDVAVSKVTTNSATVSWTYYGNPTSWAIHIYKNGKAVPTDTVKSIPAAINLQPDAKYTIYVSSLYGVNDTSEWSLPVTFQTPCEVISLPFSENFESYTTDIVTAVTPPATYPNHTMPSCWRFPYLSTSTASGAYPRAFLSNYASNVPGFGNYLFITPSKSTFIVLPEFDTPISNSVLSFSYRNYNTTATYGTFHIGVMDNSVDTTTYVEIKAFPATDAPTDAMVDFSQFSLPTSARNIVFKVIAGTAGMYNTLDNIAVNKITCYQPKSFTVSNVDENSFDIDISDYINSAWEVSYVPSGTLPSQSANVSLNSSIATVSGLSPSTYYDVYVRAKCSATEKSGWVGPYRIATPCNEIKSVPYTENFENYTTDITTSASPTATYPNNVMPTCWTFANRSASSSIYPQSYLSSNFGTAGYGAGTGNYLLIRTNASHAAYAALPEFDKPIDSLLLSFKYKNQSTTPTYGNLVVGVMSDPTDTTSFVSLQTLPLTTASTSVSVGFNYSSLPANARNIAFRYAHAYSSIAAVSIDSIYVKVNSGCFNTHFTLNNATANSVDLVIDDKLNSSWEYSVVPFGAVPTESGNPVITSRNYKIQNLTPATVYHVYVRAICATGTTAWAGPVMVTTLCNTLTPVPHLQSFNSYTKDLATSTYPPPTYPNHIMPNCWKFPGISANSYTYPQAFLDSIKSIKAGSGNYIVLVSSTTPAFAVLPEFDKPMDSLLLSFQYRNSAASTGILQVGVMTDPNDPSTFVLLKPMTSVTAITKVTNLEFNYNSFAAAKAIAFRFVGSGSASSVSIDSVSITQVTCPATHFTVNKVTSTTANVVIDDAANAKWEYYYATSGSVAPTTATNGTVVTDRVPTIQNLLPSTAYDVYLRAYCGTGAAGTWLGPVKIKTFCNAYTDLPYIEDFESASYTDIVTASPSSFTTSNFPASYPNHKMPTCWTFPGLSTNTSFPRAFLCNYYATTAVYGTGKYLLLNTTPSTSAYAILPEFTTPIDSLVLSFDYRPLASSYGGTLYVGVMTDPSDVTSFVTLQSFPQVGALTNAKVYFNYSSLPTDARAIAFRYGDILPAGSNNSVTIDNINVDKTACFDPHFTLSNVTTNSVDLTIDDNANTTWEYAAVPKGYQPSEYDVFPISESTYHISGLRSAFTYDVYLRALCGGATPTAWVGPLSFTTAQNIPAMPYFHDFENIIENENWALANGSQINKWIIGNAYDAVMNGDYSLYVSSDGGGYTYTGLPTASYVYAYRTFDLQKDTIYNIMFNWKANGESSTYYDYDLLRVFLVPADVSLTAGDANDMAGSKNTTPTGWIDVKTGSTAIGILNQQTDWQTVNNNIKVTKSGFYNLVFFWKNDPYTNNQPPAAVDNIVFRKKTCLETVNLSDTISKSVAYYMDNGFYISTDTLHNGINSILRTVISSTEGVCDTRYILRLFVVPPVQKVVSDVHCGTAPYSNYGFNIPTPATRTYKRTMYGATALGADSTVILNLAVQDLQPVTIDKTVCDNKGYYFKGDTIKVSGAYVDSLKSIYGCDSVINLNLTVLPTRDTFAVTICAGKSYLFGGSTYTATGVYEQKGLTNVLGCDSTSVLDLTVRAEIVTDLYEAICQGDTLNKYGWSNLYKPGTYIDVQPSVFGCDSTINLILDVNRKDTIPDFISVAVDKLPYDYYGFMIPDTLKTGTYQYYIIVGSNIYHCDSTVNLTVKVTPPSCFDDLYANSIKMYPNPIKVGSEVTIDCNIPESDRQDIVVEIFNVIGEKIYSVRPTVYPIKVKAFDASGIYVVRIRGAKLHYEGKIVVKE